MQLMRYCLSPNKLAWLREELGEHTDKLLAAMDAAGSNYLAELTELQAGDLSAGDSQLKFAWFQQKLALTTRLTDAELANLAPLSLVDMRVELVSSDKLTAALQQLSSESVLGFDTETRASFEPGVQHPLSLVQLATSDTCYLFQRAVLGERLAELKPLLENEQILKVGIGLRGDGQALKRDWDIQVSPRLDLNWAMAQLGAGKEVGTRQLVAALLHKRIDKPKKLTLSNWQQVPLSQAQVQYAALDALAANQCFWQLIDKLQGFYGKTTVANKPLLPPSLAARLASYFHPA
ncbi:3'-5' exonuclease [Shewanella xiamenensis]|uniref:3'-5' exonuclease n=1 Tax=Shewanella xiamenensis TaxID=332186 RepID=UPI0024A69ADF|nr:3'-5' exonuclease [Shewanella xiamenensis]MDI5835908.1 3'-5' exonuclease domain-containing protein 2 [Shewanella xiamenensis]MDI5839686.1 3'-5' exonuclease domain-containing protein 2 [Shewanella xiamenensis]MDI5851535.1 3'-5' exonuclease domain-containing protein 2 [Shewanella xiamenensis]MDI5855331.1 3'-5' exonuclease domain-containing protein 2 [Shewanella xiamenensis]MDI5859206.1 3'-5' exonuclease domain-containing protein 2 [Shewanella xiamenensis]